MRHEPEDRITFLKNCVPGCPFSPQVRKYEAEVAAVQAAKERERALAEWTAEQERVATLGLLDQAEAKRQRDRCVGLNVCVCGWVWVGGAGGAGLAERS